ncbi:MAG: STAS domain-containing protein, partial [Gammaproteobacteria bacterium]|nr:STAS domain-containing protein [Gammaproteobacteria bacterium]
KGTKKQAGSKRGAGTNTSTNKQDTSSNETGEVSVFTLNCGEDFGLRDAQDFYQQLTSALTAGQSVEVDASKVTQTDTAGLQMLYAFSKKASEIGLGFEWKNVSKDFRETADLLGMSDCLNLSPQ